MVRIELTTCCLRNSCSTTELHRHLSTNSACWAYAVGTIVGAYALLLSLTCKPRKAGAALLAALEAYTKTAAVRALG